MGGNVYKWYNHCYWVLNFSVPMACLLCDTGNGRELFHRQLSNKYTVITQDYVASPRPLQIIPSQQYC